MYKNSYKKLDSINLNLNNYLINKLLKLISTKKHSCINKLNKIVSNKISNLAQTKKLKLLNIDSKLILKLLFL